MGAIGTLPGERLAGLSADLFHKLKKGVITLEELAQFVQRKNPFEFERNEHGHIVFTIIGRDLTGAEEIERLTAVGFFVSDLARLCLTSDQVDSYNENQRLIAGLQYKIVLIPASEIECEVDRTADAMHERGIEKYGYEKPLAGIMPHILETVSDVQMEKMGFWYIAAAPYDPIKVSGTDPNALYAARYSNEPLLDARWDTLNDRWDEDGAFAFIVPES